MPRVFVSYVQTLDTPIARDDGVVEYAGPRFAKKLEEALREGDARESAAIESDPWSVFIDRRNAPGAGKESLFPRQLLDSVVFLPLCEPDYFERPWPLSEWRAFAELRPPRIMYEVGWTSRAGYETAKARAFSGFLKIDDSPLSLLDGAGELPIEVADALNVYRASGLRHLVTGSPKNFDRVVRHMAPQIAAAAAQVSVAKPRPEEAEVDAFVKRFRALQEEARRWLEPPPPPPPPFPLMGVLGSLAAVVAVAFATRDWWALNDEATTTIVKIAELLDGESGDDGVATSGDLDGDGEADGATTAVSTTATSSPSTSATTDEPATTGCVPSCGTKRCGSDGCGGSCGLCPEGSSCDSGECTCSDKLLQKVKGKLENRVASPDDTVAYRADVAVAVDANGTVRVLTNDVPTQVRRALTSSRIAPAPGVECLTEVKVDW